LFQREPNGMLGNIRNFVSAATRKALVRFGAGQADGDAGARSVVVLGSRSGQLGRLHAVLAALG